MLGERSGNSRPRTNLLLGRQNGKLIAPMLFDATINTACVNQWVESCLLKELLPNSTIVLDNARFHNEKELEIIAHKQGHKILFLPPYSPDFNPIEKSFANIKKFRQYQPLDMPIDELIKSYVSYLK